MYDWLGRIISKTSAAWLVGWILLWAGTLWAAPRWHEIARDGEFQFLPRKIPSLRGEELLRRAFPHGRAESSVVIVATRDEGDQKLTDDDRRFITSKLLPALEPLAHDESPEPSHKGQRLGRIITRFLSLQDKEAGPLLVSEDKHASLVVIELTTDFMLRRNLPLLKQIDHILARLRSERAIPAGLEIDLSGSAEIGRDMMKAESKSAHTIQAWTIGIVIILLLVYYRAPLIALVPLLTLYVAVGVALRILELLAKAGYVEVFRGLDVYTTVVAYAAGVDYNLFLISRYQEELETEEHVGQAVARALGNIGGALTASAATVICGIGTLMFAHFGKFREAGFGIALSLFVMLCATMTLAPALLRLAGRTAFWPRGVPRRVEHEATQGASAGTHGPLEALWGWVGQALQKRPGTIWVLTVLVLSPFAAYAVVNYNNLNFGLIQGLPKGAPSVKGTRALMKHYPAGDAGPLTLVIRNDRVDFSHKDGIDMIRTLADRLEKRRKELKIADLRSVADPLGITETAREVLNGPGVLSSVVAEPLILGHAIEHYVSKTKELDHHVTRLSLVLDLDPYTRESIHHLDVLEPAIRAELPKGLQGSELYLTGATASFRDLKVVADRDRNRINLFVTFSVLVVLILLLRRLIVPIYLVLSVIFGYLVTLGSAFAVFRLLDGPAFPGLDWTVPIFLFTLLIAVGEDYNIILVTRIDEEQRKHGPINGVTEALVKTGSIISGCGFIMAGTFCSLAFGGSLARMYQLGYALTFGVLLDTFVVRPVLVPAYLIFAARLRHGRSEALSVPNRETIEAHR